MTGTETGVVFDVVYADGQCVQPVFAVHNSDLPEALSEERLDFLDTQQALIEAQFDRLGVAEKLADMGFAEYFIRQTTTTLEADQLDEINATSILRAEVSVVEYVT